MREPRGHPGMYGVVPVAASDPSAAFGVLFIHNEGYSTMCGHATIALGRYAVERGLVESGDHLVIISDLLAGEALFDSVQLRVVP